MRDPYSIVISILRTEKGTHLLPINKYLFWVEKNANKLEIKSAVEEIYKVKVKKVNTTAVRGKNKRVRLVEGKTPDWKKAIVTLKPGEKIEVT
ncbi:MAG: 50S ribosomal protein L23 [Omnitrophica bacterium RBG_13_46_9]|nr:MAG: 50S ribosomal protein L23 [Omnitrophica bacterium RBG_13_46_9]